MHLFGKENVELGVWMLFMSLQSQQLNKQVLPLLTVLLSAILCIMYVCAANLLPVG